jgi:CRISPR-associated protein Cas1
VSDSPLQVKHRLSFFYFERGSLTVVDGSLVLTNLEDRTRFEVPARAMTTLLVGPGASVTTQAMRLASAYGVTVLWTGEHAVRCYSAGRPWSENVEWLDRQVRCYAVPERRFRVATLMYARRFGRPTGRRTIEELRGLEGARMRAFYRLQASRFGIEWRGRRYPGGGVETEFDAPNLALNVANTCLYGIAETAVHATGCSPALGFIHAGSQLAFVFDIADLYKTEHVVPLCFSLVARHAPSGVPWPTLESDVRRACRDLFRESDLLTRVVSDIQDLLNAGDRD